MESIKRLVEGENYGLLLEKVQNKTNIQLNEANIPLALFNYDLGRVTAAKTSADDLNNLISTDINNIVNYVIQKLKFSFEQEEEFPRGNEPEDDEKPKTIEILPYYKNFLVTALVEYFVLKNNSEELLKFLKATRIPHAKKYEKELKEIYSNL